MIQKIKEPVSVTLSFDHQKRKLIPEKIVWKNRVYPVVKTGLHHTYRTGRTLYHVFSVTSETLFFRLVLNTETLFWTLEEISDGLPD